MWSYLTWDVSVYGSHRGYVAYTKESRDVMQNFNIIVKSIIEVSDWSFNISFYEWTLPPPSNIVNKWSDTIDVFGSNISNFAYIKGCRVSRKRSKFNF